MGIDISFAVEQLIDGAWERVEEWKPGHNGREFRVEWYRLGAMRLLVRPVRPLSTRSPSVRQRRR